MLREAERLERLLTDRDRPLQIVLAGKSHPADEEGKRMIAQLGAFAARPEVRHRIVILPDYDMALARAVRGFRFADHLRFPGFALAAASAAYLMRVIRSAQWLEYSDIQRSWIIWMGAVFR